VSGDADTTSRRSRTLVAAAIAGFLLVGVVGSTGAAAGPASAAEGGGGWEYQPLGDELARGVVGGVVDGNRVVVHGAEGRLVSWVLEGGSFVPTESPSSVLGPFSVNDMAVFGDTAVIVGSDYERLVPRVWTSADGSAWSEPATAGLDRPADMLEVSSAPGSLYAAGAFRESLGTANEHFTPAIWRSTDGQHWTAVTVPGPPGNGDVTAIHGDEDSVIAAINVDDAGSIWRSTDGGASWAQATVYLGSDHPHWRVASIARLGDGLVGAGKIQGESGEPLLVVVSSDDGVTCEIPSEPLPAVFERR
jgi:hypothetical protein